MLTLTVSVIIPAHNRPELLAEALVSCLVQTRGGVEVIVVDDGSDTDLASTLHCLRGTGLRDTSVRLVRQNPSGAPAARNRGFKESAGQLIQFLDSDDLLHPKKLEIQAAVLERDPSLDMVFCLDEWFEGEVGDMNLLWNAPDGTPELDRFTWNDVVWHSGSPLWRRSALERVGLWDTRLACWQDWAFHVRALSEGIRYAHVSEVLQFVRDHRGPRISKNLAEPVRERSKLEAFRLAGQHLKEHGLLNRHRGDGLAMFLLRVAHELARLSDVAQARTALWTATRYAGSPGIKTAGLVMLAASFAAQLRRKSQVSALNRAQLLVQRYAELPAPRLWWQSIRTVRKEEPTALLEALAKARGHSPHTVTPVAGARSDIGLA